MNSAVSIVGRPHRILRWALIGVGLCLAPIAVLTLVVASDLSLERDAVVLRREVMAATGTQWHSKVQVSVGRATLNAVNFGLGFVRDNRAADARSALTAVRRASVGVYDRPVGDLSVRREKLLRNTDQAM